MIPSLLAIAVTHITITDEEELLSSHSSCVSQVISRQVFSKTAEQQSDSLLSVLDDKNKVIACLNKQLQNQKMQLNYYINRELTRSKITKLSESCMPQASEDSLPLNLAMNKFYRQSGIKTKLVQLHERMSRLDYKIANALKDQEFILRKIVNRLCELVRVQDKANFNDQFSSFLTDPLHVSLFDKLLTVTMNLGAKLDSFKICCDRVLIVEEERNAIVDQVYSLPVEERVNLNCLAEIQMEKAHLENELKRICERYTVDRHRVKELNIIEKILHNLQWELNSTYLKNEESCISKMLNKINSEARVLLEMTKEQKRKFEFELSKTKSPEPNRILLFINIAGSSDNVGKTDLEKWGIKTEEEISFFDMVKKEVDLLKTQIRKETEKSVEKVRLECDSLKGKLTEAMLDRSRTKIANKSLKQELEELKTEQKAAFQRLKQERDVFKSQVEDLQAIREAYAQLVDKQPNGSHVERKLWQEIDEKDKKMKELERVIATQREEIAAMKGKVEDQKDQIAVLNRFISVARPATQVEPRTQSVELILKKQGGTLKTGSDGCCCYNANKKLKNTYGNSSEQMFSRCRKSSRKTYSSNFHKEIRRTGNSFDNLSAEDCASCLNFLPSNSRRPGDVVHTVFPTSQEINKGHVKLEKSSVFSVEITYKKSDMDAGLHELTESEIFKDLSEESMVLNERRATARSLGLK